MHTLRIVAGTALALALSAISIACCWRFGLRLAPGFEGQLYAALGAVADACKSMLPISISVAFELRHRVRAGAGIALFVIFSAYSFTSEIGLYSMGRDAARGTVDASKEGYANIRSERDRITGRLKEIGATRSTGMIRADIAAGRQNRLWEHSGECKDASGTAARSFCSAYERFQGELAAAVEAEGLRTRDNALASKMGAVDLATVMRSADAQSEALGRFTGLRADTVRDAIALLIAALIEAGSGFALWIVTVGAPRGAGERPGASSRTAFPACPPRGSATPKKGRPADPVRIFLQVCSVPRPGAEVASSDLHRAFADWASREGLELLSPTAFGKRLTKIGLIRSKRGGTTRYMGIEIAPLARLN